MDIAGTDLDDGEDVHAVQGDRADDVKETTTLDAVLAELAHVRERGYAIDDEELNAGVRCVAVPVFGLEGAFVGCIGVSGPDAAPRHRPVPAAELVMVAPSRVTAGLGGPVAAEAVPAGHGKRLIK
jgi:DNA-binding IclR family transcriptional regulator